MMGVPFSGVRLGRVLKRNPKKDNHHFRVGAAPERKTHPMADQTGVLFSTSPF